MIPIILWLVIFAVSLTVLIKGADFFTESSEKLSLALGVPRFIVGITIVAVGTSLPELATSLLSLSKGTTEFVIGNVVGSNIANLMFVIGLAAIFAKGMKFKWDILNIDLPFLLASAFFLYFISNDGLITPFEGLFVLAGGVLFLAYTTVTSRNHSQQSIPTEDRFTFANGLMMVLGVGMVYLGGEFTLRSVITLTQIFGFSNTSLVAATLVAFGTSLPELAVSVAAVKKQNYEMALGNVLGSNVFNTFLVIGLPALLAGAGLVVSETMLLIGLPFMIAATLLFIVATQDRSVSRVEGVLFVLLYMLFIVKLIGLF
jgi:cation:H+ antiporter